MTRRTGTAALMPRAPGRRRGGRAMDEWGEIIREHGPVAFTAAWRILGDAPQAEAAAQETFRRAREVGTAREVRCWGTLFRRLAVGCALARLRGHAALRRRP